MLPPLSEDLIAAALATGAITYEQSLLYRALALFDSPGLPAEFRSPVPDMGGATALFGEIDQKEAELSAGLLEKLAPYRARPADPASIFNTAPGQAGTGMVLALATPAPVWVSQLVPGTNLRVWVKDGPFTASQLGRFTDVAARVWDQLPGVFRYGNPDQPGFPDLSVNPDGAIDVYFVETGTIDTRLASCLADPGDPDCVLTGANGYAARATLFVGTTSSGYVVVDAGLANAQLPSTLAHELTHTGQFAYDRRESIWLMESTATWASYRVMQKLGLLPVHEYKRISRTPFFKELDMPLATALYLHSELHSYASWLFFLFASMEAGDAIVTRVWEAAAAEGVQNEKAVDQAFPFDDHFADFSVRNWNQDPVTPQYKDVAPAPFPGGLQPRIVGREATVMTGAGESFLDLDVLPLASLYYVYRFESAVRKVTFENAFVGVPHAHVWAIKKIGDTWAKPEDWTKDAKKEFCRDATKENVTELVLIVSNSHMQNLLPHNGRSSVVGETTGCVGWVGEIRGKSRGGILGGSAWQETSLAQVSFIPNPTYPTYDDVEFVLGSATVSWTSQWTEPPQDMSKPGNPPPLCPTTLFSGSYEAIPQDPAPGGERGDGRLDFSPPPDGAPTPGPGSTQYALRQYEAGGISSIPYVPCEEHGGVSRSWWQIPREAGVAASPDGRTIEGTWSSTGEGGDFEYSWTWKLQYVGPP